MKKQPYSDRADLVRRIQAAGIPINTEFEGPEIATDGLWVRLDGGVTESMAFDWFGGTGLSINISITFDIQRFAISAFGLALPWTDDVRWLEDPKNGTNNSNQYFFGDTLQFDRSLVLNHRADICRIHSRGSSIVGCLLGTASASIPDDFRHGVSIPAFLDVYDQWGSRYRSPISLWSDRSATLRPARPKSKRKSLLDSPDVIPEGLSSISTPAKRPLGTRKVHR